MNLQSSKDGPVIVVTGGAGFLGAAVAKRLQLAGVTVIPVSRRNGLGTQKVGNYRETPVADVLVHLAEDSDRARANQMGDTYETEARQLVECLVRRGFRRIVYGSSAVLYGDTTPKPHLTIDAIQVTDTYTRVKQCAESMILAHKEAVVARISNLYGPGMNKGNVLGTIIKQIPGNGALTVWDDRPVRDFLWIDDAADAIARMALGIGTGIFNVGSGVGTSVFDLAKLALDAADQPDRPICATNPSGRESFLTLDIGTTSNEFGWHPQLSLKQGLKRLLNGKEN